MLRLEGGEMLRRGGAKGEALNNHRGIPTRERISLWLKKKKKKNLKSVILPVKLELSSATDSPSSPP